MNRVYKTSCFAWKGDKTWSIPCIVCLCFYLVSAFKYVNILIAWPIYATLPPKIQVSYKPLLPIMIPKATLISSVPRVTVVQRSGRGGSHIKKIGVFIGNFEKNPLERPRSCFVGGSVVFSPLRATNAQPPRKFQFLRCGGGGGSVDIFWTCTMP